MAASELTLTPKQLSTLEEFKANVKNVKKPFSDDDYHIRWLIARDWDLKKAEKMFRDSMEWREQYGSDDLLKWEVPEIIRLYMPGGWFGHDKAGHPIWFELLGYLDVKNALYATTKKDIVKNRIRGTEYLYNVLLPEQTKKFGKKVDKVVFIVDLEGIGMKHIWKPAIDIYTELLGTTEANYPEALHCAYIVNAHKLFPLLYSLVKPFLAVNTRSKIKILGGNWKESLLKDIDADQLPVHWGGTATDPDGGPYCKTRGICMGGPIPEKYKVRAINENNELTKAFLTTTVAAASFVQYEYKIDQPGSLLCWNFWTDDKDIGFGVYLRTGDAKQKVEDMEVLVPNSRVNCHMVPEADTLNIKKLGTYVVQFDNTYSWMSGKKVSYLIEVVVPDAGKELQRDSTNL